MPGPGGWQRAQYHVPRPPTRVFVIGDALWEALFSSGPLVENRGITMTVARLARISAQLEATDQLDLPRPAGALGDVGAIEVP